MSSSVAWAGFTAVNNINDTGGSSATDDWSVTVGYGNVAKGVGSIAIGHSSFATGNNSIVIGSNGNGKSSSDGDKGGNVGYDNCIVIGSSSDAGNANSVALGNGSRVYGKGSVALGYGSYVGTDDENVVSVGSGGSQYITAENAPVTRKIINVTDGENATDAATYGQVKAVEDIVGSGKVHDVDGKVDGSIISYFNFTDGDNLTETIQNMTNTLDPIVGKVLNDFYTEDEVDTKLASKANVDDVYTKALADDKFATKGYVDSTFVKISTNANDALTSGFNVVNTDDITKISVTHAGGDNPVVISSVDGITVGEHSTRMDGSGFYVWAKNDTSNHNPEKSIASIKDDGSIKGAGGAFTVDASGNVTAEKITATEVTADNLYTKDEIDQKLGGSNASVAGLSQRLDKTNAKINKVGAGAAALAALHPLEYDPDDKLTFSAGMGNYAGENAAALGAFYRPNEKFMVSLGGTMGNGENMVNLGLSIGLDKPNGYAKLSKRELIQKVNAMEAKYEAVEAENEAMKAEMAEMKAMLQAILAKK